MLCGPPHSGKSCLREGLKKAIIRLQGGMEDSLRDALVSVGIPVGPQVDVYPYVITGCPDGEGAWFQEAALNNPELARELKDEYKSKFTPEFAQRIAESVQNCTLPLTIIDVGGRMSDENRQIMSPATHAIILAGNWEDETWDARMNPWRAFCAELGLTVVAEVFSDYFGSKDEVIGVAEDGILRGSVHHLERGEDNSERPAVVALAQHLVNLATSS
ncbi:MAG: hypothetical protein ABII80_00095 [bacterium]